MYNLLSIGLGLLAWGLGIAAIAKKGRAELVFSSMTSCAIALTIQFFEVRGHASREDWSFFYDVAPTLANVAAFLMIVTVALNLAALWRGKRK